MEAHPSEAFRSEADDLGGWEGLRPEVDTIEDALLAYSAVIIEPIGRSTHIEDNKRLLTWYKVRVLETLSTPAFSSALAVRLDTLAPEITPSTLQPLRSEDLLIPQLGGIISIDGITIVSQSNDFSRLAMLKHYLALLSANTSVQTATIPLQNVALFEIDGDTPRPLGRVSHPLVEEVRRHGNSLAHVRALIVLSSPLQEHAHSGVRVK